MLKVIRSVGFIFLLVMLLVPQVYAQQLTAQISRSDVTEGTTFNLLLTAHNPKTSATPDWSPLQKNFHIIGTSVNRETSIVNGRMSSTSQWIAVLMPKRAGELTIPAIHVGKMVSNSLKLKVVSNKQAMVQANALGKMPAVFMRAAIKPKQAYVQGKILYTVRLYTRKTIAGGNISPPRVANATVRQIGKDATYQAVENGYHYEVLARRYVIFPQKSGKLTVKPAVFEGVVSEPPRASNPYGMNFNRLLGTGGRTVRLQAPVLHLTIKPKPAAFKGQWWLPAQKLTLTEHWSKKSPSFRVGDPVTLTRTIKAIGLSGDQLPVLTMPSSAHLNAYPDQPTTKTSATNNGVVGELKQKIVLVPTQTGKITIPAVKVSWWNTKTNKPAVATLPAQTYTVLLAVDSKTKSAAVPPTVAKTAQTNSQPVAKLPTPFTKRATIGQSQHVWSGSFWPWLAVLFCVAWLVTLFAWQRKKSKRKPSQTVQEDNNAAAKLSLRNAKKAIREASLSNNPKQTQAALIQWALLRWPDGNIRGLANIVTLIVSEPLKQALQQLDKILYAGQQGQWDGAAFWQLFNTQSDQQPSVTKSREDDSLPSLYL